jgi:sugar phosphate isomerase/epimerase
MASPKVGCHLIIFGPAGRDDLDGTLATVKAAGYDGVEAGLLCGGDATEAHRHLDAHGLEQGSVSTNWRMLDEFDSVVDYAKAVGARMIQMSGQNRPAEGLHWYDTFAPRFDAAARHAHDAGIPLCYHNHSWEFLRYDPATGEIIPGDPQADPTSPGQQAGGVVAMERVLARTDPTYAKLCVDVHWVHHAGLDPAAYVREHASRIGYVHIKDMAYAGPVPRRQGVLRMDDSVFKELGHGEVNLRATWDALKPLNMPWVVYEQDRTALPVADAIGISRTYLREQLGI